MGCRSSGIRPRSSRLVTKRDHAALVGFDLRQMEGNIPVELLEEGYPIANQDRQDRIMHLVSQPKAKALTGNHTASNKPDATEPGPQVLIYELRKIA
jgi:hypothetical protein